jgi:hypothetical protein
MLKIHLFRSSKALQPFVGPWLFFSFVNIFNHTVQLLGRVVSQSQGRYQHREQHKHRINAHTDIFEEAKTVDALDRAATVIGKCRKYGDNFHIAYSICVQRFDTRFKVLHIQKLSAIVRLWCFISASNKLLISDVHSLDLPS